MLRLHLVNAPAAYFSIERDACISHGKNKEVDASVRSMLWGRCSSYHLRRVKVLRNKFLDVRNGPI
jgi:hypothetical protein